MANSVKGGSSAPMFLFGAITLTALFIVLGAITMRMGPPAIPIWMFSIGGLWMISRSPIGQALAARIHSTSLGNSEAEMVVPPELYAELDELRARLSELEERQEFSERLLASRNEEKDAKS